jgi:hypothetical protein
MKMISILLAAGLALAGCASGPGPEPTTGEVVIPFVSSIQAVEWRRLSDQAVYVRGGRGEWYLVRTSNNCTRLRTALALGFETSALDQLDRYGALLVQGQRCPVASIARSGPPPKKARR